MTLPSAEQLLSVRPLVLLPIVDRHSFGHYYAQHGLSGTIWVPGFTRLPLGARVDVGVSFGREHVVMQVRGIVAAKRWAPEVGRPRGIAVELLSSERRAQNFLLRYADAEANLPVGRTSWRYPAAIAVEPLADEPAVFEATDDINAAGAALWAASPPKVGTRVRFRLRVPALHPITVEAQACWRDQGGRPRVGVQFLLDGAEQARVRALIDEIRAAMTLVRGPAVYAGGTEGP
jgi:hypothetical protein